MTVPSITNPQNNKKQNKRSSKKVVRRKDKRLNLLLKKEKGFDNKN